MAATPNRATPPGYRFSVRDEACAVCGGPVLLVEDGVDVEGLCPCDDEWRATPITAAI